MDPDDEEEHLSYHPPSLHQPEVLPQEEPEDEPYLPERTQTFSFEVPEGDSPEAIRERIKVFKRVTESAYMRLAHDLWKCYHRKLYVGYGYDTFDDYVATEVGISRDRAYKLRRIYTVLHLKCDIPTKEIEEAERARVEMILPMVDRTNARDWLGRAKTLPYKGLKNKIAEVKNRRAAQAPEPTGPIKPEPTTPIKIACEASPRGEIAQEPMEFVKRTFRLPEDGDSLLTEALAVAQRFTKSHSDAFNLICVAQQFLAHNLTLEGKKDPRKEYWTRWMEEIYGGRFLHIKNDEAWAVLADAVDKNPHLFGTGKRGDPNVGREQDRDGGRAEDGREQDRGAEGDSGQEDQEEDQEEA